MSIVVTGAAGLIGNHLVRRLVADGGQVVAVDNFSRGSMANLRDLDGRIEVRDADLRDPEAAHAAMAGAEIVYHLAARVGSIEMLHTRQDAEIMALQTNLLIDTNVLRSCVERRVPRVVFTSSVSVYPIDVQSGHGVVFSEELDRIAPEGGYGWAKFVGEIQLGLMNDVQVAIARVFNVYGEGEMPDADAHVVPALLLRAMHATDELVVWGDGTQTRDLLYVSDAVEALVRLGALASSPPVVVNVGSGASVTIRELAEAVVRVVGKPLPLRFDTTKPVGPVSRTADISRARALLGWSPQVSLDAGLGRIHDWLKARPS